jgi:hypothetical protein
MMEDMQNGLCKGRSCADGYLSFKLFRAKCWECSLQTHQVFINFKKDFDSVDKNTPFEITKNDQMPNQLTEI